jgi:hypothetical protein
MNKPMFESLKDTYVFQQQSPKPVEGILIGKGRQYAHDV